METSKEFPIHKPLASGNWKLARNSLLKWKLVRNSLFERTSHELLVHKPLSNVN